MSLTTVSSVKYICHEFALLITFPFGHPVILYNIHGKGAKRLWRYKTNGVNFANSLAAIIDAINYKNRINLGYYY
jgi:hypothetical protein